MVPEVLILQKIEWQFFGSLTFKSENLPESIRKRMWWSFARQVCKWFHVHFNKLIWCLRIEKGEVGGRIHFHFLMAGLPSSAVKVSTCFSMMRQWNRKRGGFARVSVFDPILNGGDYILKNLEYTDGGKMYETAKFNSEDSSLILSKSCYRIAASSKRRTDAILATMRTDCALSTHSPKQVKPSQG